MVKAQSAGIAVVTGASSGIGAVYADRLAARGHDLILVARRRDRLETVAATVREHYGVNVEIAVVDVTNPAELATIEAVLRERDNVSLLVNNAGSGALGALSQVGVSKLDHLIRLNVVSLTRLSHAALDGFRRRGSGGLINIGSVIALRPAAGAATYSATKAYVSNFTRSLQLEYEGSGIGIQLVLPGPIHTEFFAASGTTENIFPTEIFLSAEQLVDAALVGFDNREAVTAPSLHDLSFWTSLEHSREAFMNNVRSNQVAPRYKK